MLHRPSAQRTQILGPYGSFRVDQRCVGDQNASFEVTGFGMKMRRIVIVPKQYDRNSIDESDRRHVLADHQQDMSLLPRRQLDRAIAQIGFGQAAVLVGHGLVVHPRAAALDQAPGFAA